MVRELFQVRPRPVGFSALGDAVALVAVKGSGEPLPALD